MNSLLFYMAPNEGFFGQLFARIQEGGPVSMSLILLLFLLLLFLVVRATTKLKASAEVFRKSISLVNQVALLAVVIGLFSQLLGLIQVFDAFESLGNINSSLFAAGLKLTLLPPVFGGFTFIIGRTATLILNSIRNPELDRTGTLT